MAGASRVYVYGGKLILGIFPFSSCWDCLNSLPDVVVEKWDLSAYRKREPVPTPDTYTEDNDTDD